MTTSALNIVTGKQSTDNYPYGRLRTTMTFEVEFTPKRGYRGVTQSINPKTQRLNKPHKTTYSDFMFMTEDEKGHFHFRGISINGEKSVRDFIDLLKKYQFEFTYEQSQWLWAQIYTTLKVSAHFTHFKEGVTLEQYYTAQCLPKMAEHFRAGTDIKEIVNISFDIEELKKLTRY